VKRIFLLLFLGAICVFVARAQDVSVKVTMSTEIEGDQTITFTPDTEKIYALFKTEGAKRGDKMRGVLIAEDVGAVAPANTAVSETKIDMEGDTQDGDFNFSKPTKGWPPGKYRVEIYLNDKLVTSAKFTVKAAVKEKQSSGKEEESGD
jgi:hypothetical protein